MQVFSNARRLTRLSKPSSLLLNSSSAAAAAAADHKPSSSDFQTLVSPPHTSHQCESRRSFLHFSGISQGNHLPTDRPLYTRTLLAASISTESTAGESAPSEAVKELYDKIIDSVRVKRTMAPNTWLWSLIENCKNREDVKLLFDALQNLRIFRMSSLRIHSNFNCNLCREVTKACVRVGAINFGKKTLSKHNVYGLAPTIGSAHHLLSYAKERNDAKLMTEVMKLMKVNDVPLQAGTADIVFSICCELDNWELISKYSKRFLKAGVKLRKTAFDMWMDFAARRGDVESLWYIEKLRSESIKGHSVLSGFSCTKGLILEHKPEDAAAVIQVLNQTLSDKKSGIMAELQKLVNEWPLDVIKHQKEENRKAMVAALKHDIPAMITTLWNAGLEVNVDLEDLKNKEIPC